MWRNPTMVSTADVSEVWGSWRTQERLLRNSMRYRVINGAVFFPLQEHSKFQKTNQKPRMINCVVYNESCCVCLWTPLLCRGDTPGAEKHLAVMNSKFLSNPAQKRWAMFLFTGKQKKGNWSWWKQWDKKKKCLTLSHAIVIPLASLFS